MGQLIDARTSSNITVVLDSFNTFPLDTPVIVGQVGLNIPTATPGIIRVQLTGFRLYGLIGVINDSYKKRIGQKQKAPPRRSLPSAWNQRMNERSPSAS